MENRKNELSQHWGGEDKFDEYMVIMKVYKERETKKGSFEAIDGDIDMRKKMNVPNWNDAPLHDGFDI